MKKIVFALALGFLFVACDPVDRDIKRLEQMAADAQANGASYTRDQWEEALDEFEDITDDLKKQELNLNADDLSRISKASFAFTNTMVKQTTLNLLDADGELNDDIDEFMERVGDALDKEYTSAEKDYEHDD